MAEFVWAEGVEAVEHDPLVASDVGGWVDVFLFDQLGERFGRALEAELLRDGCQRDDGEDLAANFETEIIAPLQVLGGVREGEAVPADVFDVHLAISPLRMVQSIEH